MAGSDFSFDDLLRGDPEEWLAGLPGYQASLVSMMRESQPLTEVAVSWLAASGPRDTAPYGGARGAAAQFYDNLLREIQELFCGDDRYTTEREELKTAASWTKMGVVSFIALSIGPHVGAAAVVIAPAVAIVLAVLSRAGKTTLCDRIGALITERDELGASSSS